MQCSVFIALAYTVNTIKLCLIKGWLQNQLPVGGASQWLCKEKQSLKWPPRAKRDGRLRLRMCLNISL